jgi:hypothetical protein
MPRCGVTALIDASATGSLLVRDCFFSRMDRILRFTLNMTFIIYKHDFYTNTINQAR